MHCSSCSSTWGRRPSRGFGDRRDAELRRRTDRDGQYALDLVADAEACRVLQRAPVRIVSEESGVHERAGAAITVVLDPVDGSTNCSRDIPYWATSICALDRDGALAGLVVNQATGVRVTAVRGGGAFRDGVRLRASADDSGRGRDGVPHRAPARFAAVEAVPIARVGRARAVRDRGRGARRSPRRGWLPRAVGLSRRLPRVRRSRRRRARRARSGARHRRSATRAASSSRPAPPSSPTRSPVDSS